MVVMGGGRGELHYDLSSPHGWLEVWYSLRSLDQYWPWYKHLYIVTNGEVGERNNGCLTWYSSALHNKSFCWASPACQQL